MSAFYFLVRGNSRKQSIIIKVNRKVILGGFVVLTMPMHFLRMLQMLISFLEYMGAGRDVLWDVRREKATTVNSA